MRGAPYERAAATRPRRRRRLGYGAAVFSLAAVLGVPVSAAQDAADPPPEPDGVESATGDGAVEASAEPNAYDASREAGIYEITRTWDGAVGDFNTDGWDDLLISRHYEAPARLYRNDQGRFQQVGHERFPTATRDRHECAWGDVQQDGLPDVFCNIGGGRGSGFKPKELWIQQPDGSFVNRADEYGVGNPYGRGRDATFVDVNHDPYPDLFLGNKSPRTDGRISSNKLVINVDGERFRRADEYGVNRQVGAKTVQAIDYDGDGWEDLFLCGEERAILYRNIRGERFRTVTGAENAGGACEAALMADVSGDARPDIARVSERRLVVKRQRQDGFGVTYQRDLRNGEHLAAGFVNGDRMADLYVLQQGDIDNDLPDVMLLSKRQGSNFAKIPIPQTREGKGDRVLTIDHDRNGKDDFVVLNGYHKARGPVRLVAFR